MGENTSQVFELEYLYLVPAGMKYGLSLGFSDAQVVAFTLWRMLNGLFERYEPETWGVI